MVSKTTMNPGQFMGFILIAGVITGILIPQLSVIAPYSLYLLALILWLSSIGTNVDDFKNSLTNTRIQWLLLAITYLFMPITAFIIAKLFLTDPLLFAGYVLISTGPVAVAVAALAKLSKGDTALGFSMTAITTLLAPIMVPVLSFFLLRQVIMLDFFEVMKILSVLLILPILLAFPFRNAQNLKRISSPVILIVLFFLLGSIIAVNSERILMLEHAPLLLFLAVLHFLSGLVPGFLLSRKLKTKDRVPFVFAATIKNTVLMTAVALVFFGELAALPGAFILIVQSFVLFGLFYTFNKNK